MQRLVQLAALDSRKWHQKRRGGLGVRGFIKAELAGFARFAGVLTGERQLAHDILVDALLVASRRWAAIAPMSNPAAYVRRIIVTTFLADHRETTRRKTIPVSNSDFPDTPRPDAIGQFDNRQLLDGLLPQLPRQQRIAVVLRYYLDYDDASVAEAINTSASGVRSNISRALATLRVTPDILQLQEDHE